SKQISRLQGKIKLKLSDLLKVQCDDVLAEYVLVMVGNHKKMKEIAASLDELVGKDVAKEFSCWLGNALHDFLRQGDKDEGKKEGGLVKRK
ncbi:unnamed protein product, partial [Heterosigma akashiwo]